MVALVCPVSKTFTVVHFNFVKTAFCARHTATGLAISR